VRWVITLGSRRWPLDPEPVEAGTVILVERPDGSIRARVLTGAELPAPAGVPTYQMHACWRGRTGHPTGPRCRRCKGPMDPHLAHLERWTEHPCCEPEFQRALARANSTPARPEDDR
jgi:hypothetical protein